MNEQSSETQEKVVPMLEKRQSTQNPYLIPGAIVVAGLFIALAVVVTAQQAPGTGSSENKLIEPPQAELVPVTDRDHVRSADGISNPRDADVYLVEYSDYRCAYCGRFHATILDVLEQYEGRVSWVYRHTPYQPGGKEAAVASECIAELAGEDAFWKYTDLALNNQKDLNTDWHINTATDLGAEREAFKTCLTSGKYDKLIADDTKNAQELGGQGTPHNVLLTKEGRILPFPGAQPKEQVVQLIDLALGTL